MYLHLISLLAALMPHSENVFLEAQLMYPQLKTQNCVDSRLRAGHCLPLGKCPGIVNEFYEDARKASSGLDFQTFISKSICGLDGLNFLICCRSSISTQNNPVLGLATRNPLDQFHQTTPFVFSPLDGFNNNKPTAHPLNTGSTTVVFRPIPLTTPRTPSQSLAPPVATQQNLLSLLVPQQPTRTQTCGVNTGAINRVVGGSEATKGNYPWIAALGYRNPYNFWILEYLCGGSLISSRYVMTSAHCIKDSLLLVRLGAHDLSNNAEPSARNYRIKRTIVHENFNLKRLANDLALIELAEPVVMTKHITTICLPDEPKFVNEEFVGLHPFVAGWGAVRHMGPTTSILRDAQVPIVDRHECERNYKFVFSYIDFNDMLICAGSAGSDTCQGDSGGPLMLPQANENSFHYYVIGVVSFGYECSRTGYPGVYTRVTSYIPWIRSHMQ